MKYAPIIVFGFNRFEALSNAIKSLLHNEEAQNSDLFIFIDGPRRNNMDDIRKVKKIKEYVKGISGFKSVSYSFSEINNGLGDSIINGVSEIINKYGKTIVLEDDLVFAPNFLSFMNQSLNRYKDEKEVFSICGYSNKVNIPNDYHYDTYFCTRSSSWGWATWADRWNSVDWELENFNKYSTLKKSFNQWGGSDCWKMLYDWKCGKNKSWAIRFCFAQFLQKKVSLFPIISKVKNDGFNGQGTNCKGWSRFRCVFDTSSMKKFTYPEDISVHQHLFLSAISYHSIKKRIFSRIMYLIYQI